MKTIPLILCFCLSFLAGCDSEDHSQVASHVKCKVTLYSDGQAVREWTSTGMVLAEEHGVGWYFRDSKTNKLVQIFGTVTIEEE